MATKRKHNARRPRFHLQVGQARHTDESIVLRASKASAKRLLKLANGDGVLWLTEDDLVNAIQGFTRPVAQESGAHKTAETLSKPISILQFKPIPNVTSDPPLNSQESILQEANRIIYGDREQAYGSPRFNLDTIAQFWSVYLKRKFPEHQTPFIDDMDITAEDVAQLMILLKTARLIHNPTHRDSLVDQAGYAALQDRIQGDKP